MEKYQLIQRAGSGNFSEVYKARNIRTDEIVAIKEMKNTDEIEELLMRELKIASGMDHPNIIRLREIIKGHRDIRVVFEYMEENLLELYTSSRKGINEHQLRCILYQSALGLEYLHSRRIIHRDIKPENILINRKTGTGCLNVALIKIIDFGLAKEEYLAETDYVATRWYRSPENLVGMRKSTVAIDIFALGCVAAELFTLNPLFPGTNTIDQLCKVFTLLGTPTPEDWSKGYNELRRKNYNFGQLPKRGIASVMPAASADLIDLLDKMLQLNPEKRITAREMLFHPFFTNIQRVIPEHVSRQAQRIKEQITRRNRSTNSLLLHKNIAPSPQRKSTPYDCYFYSKEKGQQVELACVSNGQQKSRERVQLIQTVNEEMENKVFTTGLQSINLMDSTPVRMQPRPEKRFKYLNVDTLSPPQSMETALQRSNNQQHKRSPTNIAIQMPTERVSILDRHSRGPFKNLMMTADPAHFSRVLRNHSLLNEPGLPLPKSAQKHTADIQLNRSVGKVPSPPTNYYSNNLHMSIPMRSKAVH